MTVPIRAVLALDLGTGGVKVALVGEDAKLLSSAFVAYPTYYPNPGQHEQRPQDWWDAVVEGTQLTKERAPDNTAIVAIATSGQSLAYVPVSSDLEPLLERVPIWSDARASAEASEAFKSFSQADWYSRTGNGFPAELYTVFKHQWYRRHAPKALAGMRWLLGSKDWVNARLTGTVATDHSYASGLGAYSLEERGYDPELLELFDLDEALLPPILESHALVGELVADRAEELGLATGTPVVAGGVDNACMALGAGLDTEGRTYLSLGSSNWLTVASRQPVLDPDHRPFVFAHVIPGLNISAFSTFGGGSSLNWLSALMNTDVEGLLEAAAEVAPGANGVVCVPTLAGGTVLEGGSEVRGSFVGLELGHTPGMVTRAVLEGIAFSLGHAGEEMARHVDLPSEVLAVGGGARSVILLETLADVLDRNISRVANDQETATVGAATLGFIGIGMWTDTAQLHSTLTRAAVHHPNGARQAVLDEARKVFDLTSEAARSSAAALTALRDASRKFAERN